MQPDTGGQPLQGDALTRAVKLFPTMSDHEVAKRVGCTAQQVRDRRRVIYAEERIHDLFPDEDAVKKLKLNFSHLRTLGNKAYFDDDLLKLVIRAGLNDPKHRVPAQHHLRKGAISIRQKPGDFPDDAAKLHEFGMTQ